jgi:Ulp1 family protease
VIKNVENLSTTPCFWKIPNINDVYKNDLKKIKNQIAIDCISSTKEQEIPFYADENDVRSLQNKKLLTSPIINMYMHFIQEKTSNNNYIILNSELYYHFVHSIQNNDNLEELKDSDYLKPLQGSLENKKIILPINLDDKHWIFGMYEPKEEKIYVLDPYDKERKDVFDNLKLLWKFQKYEPNMNFKPIYHQYSLPKQGSSDHTSCGIFTSMYIAHLLYSNRFPTKNDFRTLDIPEIRKYMFNIIINNICKF